MGTNINRNKPSNPAPPLNAKKSPEVNPETKKAPTVRRSVYDEIAERRRREKRRIGVTSTEDREETYHSPDEIGDILDEVRQSREDDDVKVYTPHEEISSHSNKSKAEIAEFPTDIYSDDGEDYSENYGDEENFDVPPLPEPKRRIGLWVALISTLSVLCIAAAGAYCVVNGYFDGIIKML